tara:strand:+ start:462 stop:1160 length:699 start_codon:yes stop_codon:yes gene_type:complete
MSRSKQKTENTGSSNPCKYFIEWKNGSFSYYDKVQEKTIDLGHKITFMVLDSLSTVKGWDDKSTSSIYSNEVRSTVKDVLNVKSFKGGDLVSGLYKEIKDRVIALGGRYVASIYVATKIDGEVVMGNLQLKGAALQVWSDFNKENRDDILNKAVSVHAKEERKKGATKWEVPMFKIIDITEKSNEEANALDVVLQDYLTEYFSGNKTTSTETKTEVTEKNSLVSEEITDLPF